MKLHQLKTGHRGAVMSSAFSTEIYNKTKTIKIANTNDSIAHHENAVCFPPKGYKY